MSSLATKHHKELYSNPIKSLVIIVDTTDQVIWSHLIPNLELSTVSPKVLRESTDDLGVLPYAPWPWAGVAVPVKSATSPRPARTLFTSTVLVINSWPGPLVGLNSNFCHPQRWQGTYKMLLYPLSQLKVHLPSPHNPPVSAGFPPIDWMLFC